MSEHPYPRVRRVNSILREVIAETVEEMKDPRLVLVTITGVEATPDLRHAVVYYSTLDLTDLEAAAHALESATPRIRRQVGSEVRMKRIPELEFRPDPAVVDGERIDEVLRALQREVPGDS